MSWDIIVWGGCLVTVGLANLAMAILLWQETRRIQTAREAIEKATNAMWASWRSNQPTKKG